MRKFFILSHGRTGTKFMAKLLNGCDGAIVHHEPMKSDKDILFYSYTGQFRKILQQKLRVRFERLIKEAGPAQIYGESNSYLRYEGKWLRESLDAEIIYMCRDGRDFVRSAYPRKLYTELETQLSVIPTDDSQYAEKWHTMDRFERICWYWAVTYERLLEDSGGTDYQYFKSNIADKVGLKVNEKQWLQAVSNPENSTSGNLLRKRLVMFAKKASDKGAGETLPEWDNWSIEKKGAFERICGGVMDKLGYTLD
jgi:hypothetical protein